MDNDRFILILQINIQVARETPEKIITHPVDITAGLQLKDALLVAEKIGLSGETGVKAADIFMRLYKLFIEKDATMIEINPLAETQNHEVLCMDAKVISIHSFKFNN